MIEETEIPKQIDTFLAHVCVLFNTGKLKCWGDNVILLPLNFFLFILPFTE